MTLSRPVPSRSPRARASLSTGPETTGRCRSGFGIRSRQEPGAIRSSPIAMRASDTNGSPPICRRISQVTAMLSPQPITPGNAAPDFADRVPDLRFLLDHILGGAVDGVSSAVDEQRIGLVGWSFGGWRYLRRSRLTSALRLSSRSRRRGTPHRCRASSPRRSRSPGSARSRRSTSSPTRPVHTTVR